MSSKENGAGCTLGCLVMLIVALLLVAGVVGTLWKFVVWSWS